MSPVESVEMLCVEVEVPPEADGVVNALVNQPLAELDRTGTKFDNRRNLNTQQLLAQNTMVERKSIHDIVSKGRLLTKYAQSSPSSIDGRGRGDDEDSREVRQLLRGTSSLFPNKTGIRRCPFSMTGDCNGRHCEPFWKPILKQEQRRTPLCSEDCKFCHDPRHFPDDEWIKLHVHRTPAARRRAAKKTNSKKGGYKAKDCDAMPSTVLPPRQEWADMIDEQEDEN
jgi:hypothetical protein